MENKEFYYSDGKQKIGPVSLHDLNKADLSGSTLIWYEDLEDWTKLSEIQELQSLLLVKNVDKVPPPLPSERREKEISKTEVSGELKVTTKREPNENVEKLKPSNSALTFFFIWTGFHLFALITSYSEIEVFSTGPETESFWPFVEFQNCHTHFEREDPYDYSRQPRGNWKENCYFNGIFSSYDWSEFLIYIGGAFFIFLITKLSTKEAEKHEKDIKGVQN